MRISAAIRSKRVDVFKSLDMAAQTLVNSEHPSAAIRAVMRSFLSFFRNASASRITLMRPSFCMSIG